MAFMEERPIRRLRRILVIRKVVVTLRMMNSVPLRRIKPRARNNLTGWPCTRLITRSVMATFSGSPARDGACILFHPPSFHMSRITAIETAIPSGIMPSLVLVRIHTDDGLTGCGETYYTPHAIASSIGMPKLSRSDG